MTDTETEAALLALGPKLEWREWNNGVWESNYIFAGAGDSYRYVIMAESERSKVWYSVSFNPTDEDNDICTDSCPNVFTSVDLSKAACERHHATGEWD